MTQPFTTESALAAREAIQDQKSRYREKYYDEEYWADLAAIRGVRLPPYYTRPSDQAIKYWLKLSRVSYAQFVESFGWKDAAEFEAMNPTHGMKIIAGLILELGQENLRLKKLATERTLEAGANVGSSEPPRQLGYRGRAKARREELAKIVNETK